MSHQGTVASPQQAIAGRYWVYSCWAHEGRGAEASRRPIGADLHLHSIRPPRGPRPEMSLLRQSQGGGQEEATDRAALQRPRYMCEETYFLISHHMALSAAIGVHTKVRVLF